jgi:hypothetical protein
MQSIPSPGNPGPPDARPTAALRTLAHLDGDITPRHWGITELGGEFRDYGDDFSAIGEAFIEGERERPPADALGEGGPRARRDPPEAAMLTARFGLYGIRGEDLFVRYEGGTVGGSEHGTPGLRDEPYIWVSAAAFSRIELGARYRRDDSQRYDPFPDLERFAAAARNGDQDGMEAARTALGAGLRVLEHNAFRLDEALSRLVPPPGHAVSGQLLAPRRDPFLPAPGGFLYATGTHGLLVLVPADGPAGAPGGPAWAVAPVSQDYLLGHVTDLRAGPGVPPSLVSPNDPGDTPYVVLGPGWQGDTIACHSLRDAMAGVFRLWKAAGEPETPAPAAPEPMPSGPVRPVVPPPGSGLMPGKEVASKWLEREERHASALAGTLFGAAAAKDAASRIRDGIPWTSPPYQDAGGPRFLVLTPWPLSLVEATVHKAVVGIPAAVPPATVPDRNRQRQQVPRRQGTRQGIPPAAGAVPRSPRRT